MPLGLQVAIKFTTFDIMGPCDKNYIVVTTYTDNSSNDHKFCSDVSAYLLTSVGSNLFQMIILGWTCRNLVNG